jgi:exopolyphosphatase/guanosine-5'-triphosphate,3'-diphosphate pyrophosphatase
MERIAVIDLGSNTFHLMIVEPSDEGRFNTIVKERKYIGLSDGGGDIILPERIKAGEEACNFFKSLIEEHGVREVKALGTAVLRSASNRLEMIQIAESIFNTQIEIISGQREAELIYKGISLIAKLEDSIIMDIGGGSVEFIITKMGKKVWSESYPIGLGPLYRFHTADPISVSNIAAIHAFLDEHLNSLQEAIERFHPKEFIGASGTFEVIEDAARSSYKQGLLTIVNLEAVIKLIELIITSSTEERTRFEFIPSQRVKLIVVAMVLFRKIIGMIEPSTISISPYALKEGMIKELLFEN